MDFNIKKLITLALIIGVTTLTQAQSNLVFNQALAFSLTGGSSTAVVPEGKVWKFESWTGNLRVTTSGSEYGSDVFIGSAVYNNSRAVWLPQGTTIYGQDGIPQQNFSILEFNVVAISSSGGGGSGGGVSADGFTASGIINLEFSGTNSSGNLGTITDLGNLTVPEGKIWKLGSNSFSIGSDPSTLSFGSGYSGNLYVDGFYVSSTSPLYLSAGTYEVTGKSSASGGGGIYYIVAKLGGLEYNAN
tara:strand:+ start:838 stop:1572 length:735 start_codon:yes stop_codon:yes gene_type:complete